MRAGEVVREVGRGERERVVEEPHDISIGAMAEWSYARRTIEAGFAEIAAISLRFGRALSTIRRYNSDHIKRGEGHEPEPPANRLSRTVAKTMWPLMGQRLKRPQRHGSFVPTRRHATQGARMSTRPRPTVRGAARRGRPPGRRRLPRAVRPPAHRRRVPARAPARDPRRRHGPREDAAGDRRRPRGRAGRARSSSSARPG